MGHNLQEKKHLGFHSMIPLTKIKRIMKANGAKRVSEKAAKKINIFLERKIADITKKAVQNASFAGRTTIKEEDITGI